jgi:death-on-curing protein
MRYLTRDELLYLHARIIDLCGGSSVLRNARAVKAALDQPQQTQRRESKQATLIAQAAALGYAIMQSVPFMEGNKRVGHAAMEAFLLLQGHEIKAPLDEQENIILQVAAGVLTRDELATWLAEHVEPHRSATPEKQ